MVSGMYVLYAGTFVSFFPSITEQFEDRSDITTDDDDDDDDNNNHDDDAINHDDDDDDDDNHDDDDDDYHCLSILLVTSCSL